MSKVGAAFVKLGGDFKNLAGNVGNAFKSTVSNSASTAGAAGRFVGRIGDSAASWAVNFTRLPVKGLSGVYRVAPALAAVGTTVGAIALGTKFIRGGAARRTEQELRGQVAQAEQDVAAYRLAPGEYAAAEAQMRQNGQGVSQVDALAARQAQAQAAAAKAGPAA